MARWLTFVFNPKDTGTKKTNVWDVKTSDGHFLLGQVRWFSRWRKYSFMPAPDTVFEERCLTDIAEWCQAWTAEHKRVLKEKKGK